MVVPSGSARERRSRTTYRPTEYPEGSTHVDTFTGYHLLDLSLGARERSSVAVIGQQDCAAAGDFRVFADFQRKGEDEGHTLGADVPVSGAYTATPLPRAALTAAVGEYRVTLSGKLTPGTTSKLTLSVDKGGVPVTDLQPYLAAYGHLIALRQGDLAYLHVHPDGEPGDGTTRPGPNIVFYAEVPTAGTYRLYLDFKHGDVVRTAEFTAVAGGHGH